MKREERDAFFSALASEQRRRVLDILKKEPGCNANRAREFFAIGRLAVMKHLSAPERADPVISEKAELSNLKSLAEEP